MLTLFPDEKIVSQSDDNSVTLTTHRICYEYREFGRSYNQNVMLEHITSCESVANSSIGLLIFTIICTVILLITLINNASDEAKGVFFILGIIGLIFWGLSKKKIHLYRLSKYCY